VPTLMRISDVQSVLATSRSTVYRLLEAGELERVYLGSVTRIVDESVQSYIQRLRVQQTPHGRGGNQS
jgi:excisionase family DNA binding protein